MNVLATDPSTEAPEPFSVSAPVSLQERRYRTIKSGDTFGVFDHAGDILSLAGGTDGLYHRDTRHLSRFDLSLGGARPLLLSATLAADNVMLTTDLSNASTMDLAAAALDQGLIHIQRSLFLGRSALHQRLAIRNFAFVRHRVRLELRFDADFADLFEVRGMQRERRGERLTPCSSWIWSRTTARRSSSRWRASRCPTRSRGRCGGRGRRSWPPSCRRSGPCAPSPPDRRSSPPATRSSTRRRAAPPMTCGC
jgi:glycogen debranching enzyme